MSSFAFNQFPVNFRVPGQYVEFDNSRAVQGVVSLPQKILLIGQKLSSGSAAAGVVRRVTGADEVSALAGLGSMLHHMAVAAFRSNSFTPTYILPLADNDAGAASTRTVTITGPASATGELALTIGDRRYGIGVASADTATAIALAIEEAVQDDDLRYVDADAVAGVVTLTARHKGVDAGKIAVTLNRYASENLPAGVGCTISALTAGTLNPSLTAAIAALGEEWYPTFCLPYTDATSLTALESELEDRFGPLRQIEGYAFSADVLSFANAVTLGESRNSPHLSIVDASDTLSPPFKVAAACAAVDAGESDPARPRQTLALPALLSKSETGRRTLSERNQLLEAGISTLTVDAGGVMRVERFTTTYRLNSYGLSDQSYFDTESLRTLAVLRYSLRARVAQKYPRHKLGKDGSLGPNVMTPSTMRGELIALYKDWMEQGWVEGGTALEQFKADLVVEIDDTDPNRLNALMPPDLINQLRVFAGLIQFRR